MDPYELTLVVAKAMYAGFRGSVVPSMQGPEWERLSVTEHLQWMNAADAAIELLPTPTSEQVDDALLAAGTTGVRQLWFTRHEVKRAIRALHPNTQPGVQP